MHKENFGGLKKAEEVRAHVLSVLSGLEEVGNSIGAIALRAAIRDLNEGRVKKARDILYDMADDAAKDAEDLERSASLGEDQADFMADSQEMANNYSELANNLEDAPEEDGLE